MLENISLIACIISALSVITTSFRAIGVSREFSRHHSEDALRTSCRIEGHPAKQPVHQRSSLRLHVSVTIVWYVLSVICSIPFFINKIESHRDMWLFIWISAYLLLIILTSFIWKKALQKD
ncbi:MAG TPA: hypothetical protein DDX85_10520 [Nitrospiraceae bacterium]|nr:hypothetical protein [Nitrospiraceae bacterium]